MSKLTWKTLIRGYLLQPSASLSQEPILVLFILCIDHVYGIMYLYLDAYPVTFQVVRDRGEDVGVLSFIGILIGVITGSSTITYITKTRFARRHEKYGSMIPKRVSLR